VKILGLIDDEFGENEAGRLEHIATANSSK
jgi:hypothetical protein